MSQLKIVHSVFWAGNELVTRYTQSGNAQLCQTILLYLACCGSG
jgi:hypothetical protein